MAMYFKFDLLGTLKGGKPRMLRYDVNAIVAFEQAMGMGFFASFGERFGFEFVRNLVWAGLRHQDPRLTPEKVGELINERVIDAGKGGLLDVFRPAMKAVVQSGVLQALSKEKKAAQEFLAALDELDLEDEDFEAGGHRPPGPPEEAPGEEPSEGEETSPST